MKLNCNKFAEETAASFTEYAIIAALLVGVFAVGFLSIQNSSESRGEASMETVSDMVPCGSTLSGDGCI